MRHLGKTIFGAILTAACLVPAAVPAAPAPAAPRSVRSCSSADLRYPFQPGGAKDFGVFRLRISGGSCATAHHVATTWMKRFESAFRAGRTVLPRSVDGFTFQTLPARVVQTFRERGRTGATTIVFDYRIPNG